VPSRGVDTQPDRPLLEVEGVNAFYGTVQVLRGVSLVVHPGEVVAVLGSNGTGKSTLLRTISGLLPARNGTIRLLGRRIDGLHPKAIVRLGIAHCPEGRKVFPYMTVRENLRLGAYALGLSSRVLNDDVDAIYGFFPRLRERARQVAGTLSGGEQQMLALGRALMARPQLLLLDEPSLGLAPLIVRDLFEIIRGINARGTAILLVEQNAYQALRVAHRGYVMETGRFVLDDQSEALRDNPKVRATYLGG
jgi:branched-chain amino acid transport system ATP-binding protein